ncbi:MAG: N-acetylmuramoyl-L-alanine amidase [Deltaproteobacteria bacterium]|nr:N-acetylmuramoyl-L-alanine amidase [Deltaproteobacteria bacterium]
MSFRPSGKLIIGGQVFQTDAPIVNWREGPKWDATSQYCIPTATERSPACKISSSGHVPYGNLPVPYTRRYSTRPPLRTSKWNNGENAPYDAVKSVIKQFIIHHDGCASADMCFNVLQNERGLSCHFLIDNDGTIYQTIDLALMAYHAAEWNLASIGVELCNRGDAKKEPTYYSGGRHGPTRDVKPCKINGHTFLAYDYTPAQYDALNRLCRALLRLLPNLPAEYPQASPGVQNWDTMPTAASFGFSGYLGHYHLTAQKWDPGYFDFKEFCSKLRGELCFPVFPREDATTLPNARPVVPQQSSQLKEAAELLYKMNEQRADGGFFPVGPWGEARLWHGGVHLAGKAGAPVFAPFPGRLVAARMGADSPVGSVNFVLLRHRMALGSRKVEFYSLYMHLADDAKPAPALAWMAKSELWKAAKPGTTVLLDEPIEAGTVIGHVGKAGPAELSRAQIHVEIFAASDLFQEYPGSPWEIVDGSTGGRFSDSTRVNDIIDANKDGLLSRTELSSFYGGGSAAATHYLVAFHVSEWTAEPSWSEALRLPKDFKGMKPDEIDALVAEQITPGLWWDDKVAAHARLPPDGVVYHYHPVSFVAWFNQQLLDAAADAKAAGVQAIAANAKEVPPGVTDDLGDVNGTSMRSTAEVTEDPCNAKLTLKELVEGFDAPECIP